MSYDPFAGSDEEFLKTPIPEDLGEEKKEETPAQATPENQEEKPAEQTPEVSPEAPAEEQPSESTNVSPEAPAEPPEQPKDEGPTPTTPPPAKPPEAKPEEAQAKPEPTKEQAEGEKKDNKTPTSTPPEDTKYKSFYEALTGPIKGGGTTVTIQSAEEAKKLIQMGLDYTRKMQAIAEDRRYIDMLGKAGLLDETKIDHLIAISQGDKNALAAFFKNSKIDPVDIDPKEGDKYKPGAHVVSKQESTFKAAIADVRSEDGGTETITEINDNWDKESKEVLYNNPGVLKQIHDYRMNGTYTKIANQVRELKAKGQIAADIPFIYAFKEVGNQMQKAGHFAPAPSATPKPPTTVPAKPATPVATRPASSTASKVGTAAAKASATRSTPAKQNTTKVIDIMALSDEELLKLKL